MNRPNLFEIATSELSQDAFIAWLLKWSNKQYKKDNEKLHNCAIEFTQKLINKNIKIEKIEVGRQLKNIDVWAIVNDKYFIIIEDKKRTKEHSNQLLRYKEYIKANYNDKKYEIFPVYFKMEEQSNFNNVKKAGYTIFDREKMLSIISKYNDCNDILSDYIIYLKNLEEAVNSYKNKLITDWYWYSWFGFFSKLQDELQNGNWGYVPNRSGGFIGFWWNWHSAKIDNIEFYFYLQLEYDKLIIKIKNTNNNSKSDIKKVRSKLRDILYEVSKKEEKFKFKNYGRIGKWMGISKLNSDYRIVDKNNLINIDKTIKNLKVFEDLLLNIKEKIDLLPQKMSK